MEPSQSLLDHRRGRIMMATVLIALATFASVAFTHQRPLTESSVAFAATLAAFAVLAMAALTASLTPYPRWAHWTGAAVLAACTLASLWLVESPEAWKENARPLFWMMPWFVMVTAMEAPRRSERACTTTGMRGGWLLVGMSTLIGGVLMFVEHLTRAL